MTKENKPPGVVPGPEEIMADALTKLQSITLKLVGPSLLAFVAAGSVGGTVLYRSSSTVETEQATQAVRLQAAEKALDHATEILERLVERVAKIESNRFTDQQAAAMEARILAHHAKNSPAPEVVRDIQEIKQLLREMDARQREHERAHGGLAPLPGPR